jgi:hypothetical protein
MPIEVKKGETGITLTRPPKKIGDALLHPRSVQFLVNLISSSFSWLSSSLPFYSPLTRFKIHASHAGGARIQTHV